jgi:hypothetical protein
MRAKLTLVVVVALTPVHQAVRQSLVVQEALELLLFDTPQPEQLLLVLG